MSRDLRRISRALLSVSDKTGLIDFARALSAAGVDERRFRRIEGVADTDPYNAPDHTDPRNRRISVTLLYRDA